jgi:hypothetical protein
VVSIEADNLVVIREVVSIEGDNLVVIREVIDSKNRIK